MTETAQATGGFTVKRTMLAILGFQVGMALVLAGSDLIGALPQLLDGTRAPALDAPVAPGDQVRRFRPGDLPGRTERTNERNVPIPDPGDMPDRLRFTLEDGVALVTGAVSPRDGERFAEWLEMRDGVQAVRLHSPGGSVMDALAIGAAIREAGLDTLMEGGDICLSACPYILAGGVNRTVPDAALVGVHQHYFGESTALPAFLAIEDIQRGQGTVMAHLDAMGVDVRVMEHALTTPPGAIYILLPEELESYRLVWQEPEAEAE